MAIEVVDLVLGKGTCMSRPVWAEPAAVLHRIQRELHSRYRLLRLCPSKNRFGPCKARYRTEGTHHQTSLTSG